jgi:hypothetical protein
MDKKVGSGGQHQYLGFAIEVNGLAQTSGTAVAHK